MPDFILKYNITEWNDLVEANDPLVNHLKALIDETQKRVNDDFTIKLQVGGKKVSTLSPSERAKRTEDDKQAAKKAAEAKKLAIKELQDDRELIAKLWAKSSSLSEIVTDLREMNASGPISKKRDSVFALNKDKKFLKEFKLSALPRELENFETTEEALMPHVLAELKTVFQQNLDKTRDTEFNFGDLEDLTLLTNIVKHIAGKKKVNDKKYVPMAQKIIIDFFQRCANEMESSDRTDLVDDIYIMPAEEGELPSTVYYTMDFVTKYIHEL